MKGIWKYPKWRYVICKQPLNRSSCFFRWNTFKAVSQSASTLSRRKTCHTAATWSASFDTCQKINNLPRRIASKSRTWSTIRSKRPCPFDKRKATKVKRLHQTMLKLKLKTSEIDRKKMDEKFFANFFFHFYFCIFKLSNPLSVSLW